MSTARVPELPVAQVRAAIAADDWSLADELLTQHHELVTLAVRDAGMPLPADGPWRELLSGLLRDQNQLMGELKLARDEAEAALARLGADRRGAQAWLRELA
ncbi:MAG TPA: hypothetical protein VIT90_14495 [Lysobacter sp.]